MLGCLNPLQWDKNISLETKFGQGKLRLNKWLGMDVKLHFLRERNKRKGRETKERERERNKGKRERERGTKKTITSINGLFKASQSIQITKKSQTPPLGRKCKENNPFQTEFKEGNANGMDTSLKWIVVVGRRRFTSEHRTVGEVEDRINHGKTKGWTL